MRRDKAVKADANVNQQAVPGRGRTRPDGNIVCESESALHAQRLSRGNPAMLRRVARILRANGGRYVSGYGAYSGRDEVICERCNKGRCARGEEREEGWDYMRMQEEIDRDGALRGWTV